MKVLFLIFLSVIASVKVLGQGGAFVPGNGIPAPFYFSGTNSRAFGELDLYPQPSNFDGPYSLAWSRLTIGGLVAKEWEWEYSETVLVSNRVEAVMFDSTIFESGSQVAVTTEGGDTAGQQYFATANVLVQNVGRLWQNPDWDEDMSMNGADLADWMLPYLGYESIRFYGDHTPAFFGPRASDSLIYVNEHGDNYMHCLDAAQGVIFAYQDYQYWRQLLNGFWYPPYNFSFKPPVNILLAEWCNGGDDPPPSFDAALHPQRNHYVSEIENQAVLANTVYVMTPSSWLRAFLILEQFDQGKTVLEVVDELVDHASTNWGSLMCKDTPASFPRPQDNYQDYMIYGDDRTRINTVYTGDHGAPQGWVRQL